MIRTRLQSFATTHAALLSGLLIVGLLGSPAAKASTGGSGTFAVTGSSAATSLLQNGKVLTAAG